MNRRKSLPQRLIELMVADHKRRHGMPVDVAKLRRDRAKFIRALGADYDERITGIVSETAELAFSRMDSPKSMPQAEAAKVPRADLQNSAHDGL